MFQPFFDLILALFCHKCMLYIQSIKVWKHFYIILNVFEGENFFENFRFFLIFWIFSKFSKFQNFDQNFRTLRTPKLFAPQHISNQLYMDIHGFDTLYTCSINIIYEKIEVNLVFLVLLHKKSKIGFGACKNGNIDVLLLLRTVVKYFKYLL